MKVSDGDSSGRHERLYTMLLEAIPSSVLLIDRDGRIVSANRNFLEKSRRSMSDTIGYRLDEVFPSSILDYMDLKRRILQVFEQNQPTAGERMTYRTPGLPLRIYYYRILPFSRKEIVENAMLLMDDVTEQVRLGEEVRRVERHLAGVVESASDIVLSTDIEGKILTWNTAAQKVTSYTVDEVKGRHFSEYCATNHEEVLSAFSAMKKGKSSHSAEWTLVTKLGNSIPVSWVCSPMKDDLGQTVGIVAVGRDLTEQRKLEAQLLQSQKLSALGVMAGGIAHEIRNPLAVCSSAAQFLMEDDIAPEFRKECAERIHWGVQKASAIIENLLRFARPGAITDFVAVDLVSTLRETLGLIENQARLQKVDLASRVPEKGLVVKGNASLLQQVFMNLFLNAIDAMPDGGRLTVSSEQDGHDVVVRVTDTGHGLSREAISNIFDPFYTTSPVGKGTGLGLSLCYSIVDQHSGIIEVESVEGKGSTLIVRLPHQKG